MSNRGGGATAVPNHASSSYSEKLVSERGRGDSAPIPVNSCTRLNDMQMTYPNSEAEWHALRRKNIGSTESPALFGYSPYMTAYELAVAKRENIALFRPDARTRWGQRLQGVIADAFEEEYGARVKRADHTYYSMDNVRAGCTIDHIITQAHDDTSELGRRLSELGNGILEIKNVDKWEFKEKWPDGEAPAHIEIQLQHQMAVTGMTWGCIFAFVGGNEVNLLYRDFEPKVGERIANASTAFWTNLEVGKMPPPVMPEDAEIMCKLYRYSTPAKVFDAKGDESLKALVEDYRESKQTAKDAEEFAHQRHAEILQHIGDAERVVNCGPYSIWAGQVAEADIAYHREGYRGFKVTEKKRK